MSTANTVVVTCLLDDGSGTFPTDISSQVSLSAGVDISGYGRADESTSASAAQLTLTVKNNDGSFTTGVPGGFGGGGFGGGFFGGVVPISKGQRIRFGLTVNASHRDLFTGIIDSLAQSFTGAPGKRSDVTITALDAMSDYGKRPARSMLEQEILLVLPTSYYTLSEAEGATSAGDTTGHASAALTIAGTGAPVTFGSGIGPTDGLTATTFAGGKYLSATPTNLAMTGSWSVVVFYSTTVTPGVGIRAEIFNVHFGPDTSSNNLDLGINNTGNFSGSGPVSGGFQSANATNNGGVHCAIVTYDGTNIRLYDDGTLDATVASTVPPTAASRISVGGAPFTANAVPFTGVISHVGVYDGIVLTAPQVTNISAALTGFAETSDARLTRIASYAGATAITTTPSGQIMPQQATAGSALLDALGVVADAEGGFLFIDGSGQLRMQGRNYRAVKTAADLSLSGKAVDPASFSVVDDTAQAINFMTVTRSDGATQTWPTLAPATNLYPGSLDLTVDTDDAALARAQWMVAKHAVPAARLPSATTTNLRTSASAAGLFAREVGDRLHFTGLPATTTPRFGDVTIEGWSMHLDRDTWTYTYNVLPWSLAQAWVLDSATYSVLDSTTQPGY